MAYDMDEKRWKVGELAAGTGLTVRALHHWDELGLLTPSEHTGAGYRLYCEADVERLYRIVALRGLGLSLQEVRDALEGGADLRELERRLRERLVRVLEAPTSGELMATIEVMTMIEKHYTPQQLATNANMRRAPILPSRASGSWRRAGRKWSSSSLAAIPASANRSTECTARWGWKRRPGKWSSPS